MIEEPIRTPEDIQDESPYGDIAFGKSYAEASNPTPLVEDPKPQVPTSTIDGESEGELIPPANEVVDPIPYSYMEGYKDQQDKEKISTSMNPNLQGFLDKYASLGKDEADFTGVSAVTNLVNSNLNEADGLAGTQYDAIKDLVGFEKSNPIIFSTPSTEEHGVLYDIGAGVWRAARNGTASAYNNALSLASFLSGASEGKLDSAKWEPWLSDTYKLGATGSTIEGLSQFVMGWAATSLALSTIMPTGAALGALGIVSKIAEPLRNVKGFSTFMKAATESTKFGLVDATFMRNHEKNLANLVADKSPLGRDIAKYFALSPDDTFGERALKSSIEGGVVGAMGKLLFSGLKAAKTSLTSSELVSSSIRNVQGYMKRISEPGDKFSYIKQSTKQVTERLNDTLKNLPTNPEELEGIFSAVDNSILESVNFKSAAKNPEVLAYRKQVDLVKKSVKAGEPLAIDSDTILQDGALSAFVKRNPGVDVGGVVAKATLLENANLKALSDSVPDLRTLVREGSVNDLAGVKDHLIKMVQMNDRIKSFVSNDVPGAFMNIRRHLADFTVSDTAGTMQKLIDWDISKPQSRGWLSRLLDIAELNPERLGTVLEDKTFNPNSGAIKSFIRDAYVVGMLSKPTIAPRNLVTGLYLSTVWRPLSYLSAATINAVKRVAGTESDRLVFFKDFSDVFKTTLKAVADVTVASAKVRGKYLKGIKAGNSRKSAYEAAFKDVFPGSGLIGDSVHLPDKFTNVDVAGLSAIDGMFNHLKNFASALRDYTFVSIDAADRMSKGVAYRSYLNRELADMARARGLEGRAKEAYLDYANRQVASAISESTTKKLSADSLYRTVAQDAADHADLFNFTNQLSGSGNTLRGWVNHMNTVVKGFPLGSFIIPFVKTPMNVFDFALARTPLLRRLSSEYQIAIARGGKEALIAHGEMSTAIMHILAGFYAHKFGIVRIPKFTNLFDSKSKAGRERLGGYRPNSLNLGGASIGLQGISPISTFLRLGSVMHQIVESIPEWNQDASVSAVTEATAGFVLATASALGRELPVDSLVDLYDTVHTTNVKGVMGALSRGIASTVVPSIVSYPISRFAEHMGEVENLWDAVANRFGVPSKYRFDFTGEPLLPDYRYKQEDRDFVDKLNILDVSFGAPLPKTVDHVNLTYPQYARLNEIMRDRGVKEILKRAVEDTALFNPTNPEDSDSDAIKVGKLRKKAQLENMYKLMKKEAIEQLFRETPELRESAQRKNLTIFKPENTTGGKILLNS